MLGDGVSKSVAGLVSHDLPSYLTKHSHQTFKILTLYLTDLCCSRLASPNRLLQHRRLPPQPAPHEPLSTPCSLQPGRRHLRLDQHRHLRSQPT